MNLYSLSMIEILYINVHLSTNNTCLTAYVTFAFADLDTRNLIFSGVNLIFKFIQLYRLFNYYSYVIKFNCALCSIHPYHSNQIKDFWFRYRTTLVIAWRLGYFNFPNFSAPMAQKWNAHRRHRFNSLSMNYISSQLQTRLRWQNYMG